VIGRRAAEPMAMGLPESNGRGHSRVFRAIVRIALGHLAGLVAVIACMGCQPAGSAGIPGLIVSPPPTWRRIEPTAVVVPGVLLAAWSGPEGSSLAVYRDLPDPGGSPATIAEALANRLENLPGLTVRVKRTESLGGSTAAHVEVTAPGTGDALAPSGVGTPIAPEGKQLVPTRQVTIGFVRHDGTFYLRWHAPESSYDRIAPDIRATLDTLRITAD
jgi:hypothetical protein